MSSEYLIIFVTASDRTEAAKIAKGLLDRKFVACVNIVNDVHSMFWWQGKIDNSDEVLLMIKTSGKCLDDVVNTVKLLHSYSVPEIIAIPVVGGNSEYLDWIAQSVDNKGV